MADNNNTVTDNNVSGDNSNISALAHFSEQLADAVRRAAASVVRVDDGTSLTATGVIFRADGVIVATSHGVEQDENVFVELADGSRHAAIVVGRDNDTDLAVLRVQATGLSAIEIAPDTSVRVGSLSLVVARPGDRGLQATFGIVSTRHDTETDGQPEYIINTDAVLYPGFSGAPLVDVQGRMIGLANRMYGRGAGIAVGSPLVARVVQAILTHGRVARGYLGIRMQLVALPEAITATLQPAQERGLLVLQVEKESPAAHAGLMLGDTLLRIDNQPLQDVDALRNLLRADQSVTLSVLRAGAIHEIAATAGVDLA